jgi:hypothetical protein
LQVIRPGNRREASGEQEQKEKADDHGLAMRMSYPSSKA